MELGRTTRVCRAKRLGLKIEAKRLGGKRPGGKRLGGETSCYLSDHEKTKLVTNSSSPTWGVTSYISEHGGVRPECVYFSALRL